jgi:hypothetical protein
MTERGNFFAGEGIVAPEVLAERLPSLRRELRSIGSEHHIFYNYPASAAATLAVRHALPPRDPAKRGTDILAQRANYLNCLLEDPSDYLSYYTPGEVLTLSDKLLEVQERWGQTGYLRGVLGDMEAVVEVQHYYAERDAKGNYLYDDLDAEEPANDMLDPIEEPPAVTWDTHEDEPTLLEKISETAIQASDAIRHFMLANPYKNIHRHKYLMDLFKPGYEEIDQWQLKAVQQFVADSFACDVIGARQGATHEGMKERCLSNAEIIEKWFSENDGLLDQLPDDFKIDRRNNSRKGKLDRIFQDANARTELKGLIRIMRLRQTSGEASGILRSLETDVHSFYRLQIRIAMTIDEIKQQLPEYTPTQLPSVRPITPLT